VGLGDLPQHLQSACAVSRFKTISHLSALPSFKNNVSKTLIEKKSHSYRLFTI